MIRRLRFWLIAATLGLLPLLALAWLARPAAVAASETGTEVLVYLPVVFKPRPGIQGYVKFNGVPESGAFLELRFYNGQSYSTQSSTYTDSDGFYSFTTAPSLAPGQSYYVRYLNTGGTPGRLWFWGTADITNYSAGTALPAGDFDLGDVTLSSPAPGATVFLPAEFHWVPRSATPSDSYLLTIFDPDGDAFYQSQQLGNSSGMLLFGLPGDFHSGPDYGWEVNIISPDGGFGTSYYYSPIHFSNLAASEADVEGATADLPAARPVDRPQR